jgi:fluoride exporter
MDKFLLISLGAMLGANARYWIGNIVARKLGASFPYGTLIINITGSLLLGFFLTLATERLLVDPRWRLLIAVGFLGAYTTFSTYTYESLSLIQSGQWVLGIFNSIGSVILGVGAVGLGIYLAKLV